MIPAKPKSTSSTGIWTGRIAFMLAMISGLGTGCVAPAHHFLDQLETAAHDGNIQKSKWN
jgi:hypothetical protein